MTALTPVVWVDDQIASPARDARPFDRLQPTGALTPEAFRGLPMLRLATDDDRLPLARALVAESLRLGRPLDLVRRRPPQVGVLNRRRRAALLWLNSVFEGRCDESTLRTLVKTWIPQLAGTGPDAARAAERAGPHFVEFVRGLVTARIFDAPRANLVSDARALLALENVLAVHLRALRTAAATPSSATLGES